MIRLYHIILISLRLTLSLLNNMAKLNRLKEVLVEQDKTSKWLAEQVGKSACTVSKWCNNRVQPDLNTLDKIVTLLAVDKRDLLTPSNQE